MEEQSGLSRARSRSALSQRGFWKGWLWNESVTQPGAALSHSKEAAFPWRRAQDVDGCGDDFPGDAPLAWALGGAAGREVPGL